MHPHTQKAAKNAATLSVLIPVRDEEESLGEFHQQLQQVISNLSYDTETIYIENGSRDKTLNILHTLPSAIVIELRLDTTTRKIEKTAAIKAGIDHATGEIIATIDADLQNDPASLPSLLEKLEEGYDAVIGWRRRRRDPWSLRIVSRAGRLFRHLCGCHSIHDSACGLKVFRRECTENLPLFGEWERYLPDLIAMQGWHVTEIPIVHHPRHAGYSKYPWTKCLRALADLLGLWFWRRYAARPLHFFGSLGILLISVGTSLWGVLGVLRLFEIIYLSQRIWPLVATTLLLIGLQLLFFGLIADFLARIYYKDREPYRIRSIRSGAPPRTAHLIHRKEMVDHHKRRHQKQYTQSSRVPPPR